MSIDRGTGRRPVAAGDGVPWHSRWRRVPVAAPEVIHSPFASNTVGRNHASTQSGSRRRLRGPSSAGSVPPVQSGGTFPQALRVGFGFDGDHHAVLVVTDRASAVRDRRDGRDVTFRGVDSVAGEVADGAAESRRQPGYERARAGASAGSQPAPGCRAGFRVRLALFRLSERAEFGHRRIRYGSDPLVCRGRSFGSAPAEMRTAVQNHNQR